MELLKELLDMLESGEARIQPYTLFEAERAEAQKRIDDWLERARVAVL